ncbi:MAG: hypothetical protein ACLPX7_16160 [Xanthobacteraceae bacterium]
MKIASTFALALFSVALAPVAAIGGEQEDRQACMNDALTVCAQFIPDRSRIEHCLFVNRSRISPACQAVMTRSSQPTLSPAALTNSP